MLSSRKMNNVNSNVVGKRKPSLVVQHVETSLFRLNLQLNEHGLENNLSRQGKVWLANGPIQLHISLNFLHSPQLLKEPQGKNLCLSLGTNSSI